METGCRSSWHFCHPFSPAKHSRLVRIGEFNSAMLTSVRGLFRTILRPVNLAPLQHLERIAVRTRNMKSALIAQLIGGFYSARTFNRGSGDHDVATIPERGGSLEREVYRITFRACGGGILIDFIATHNPDWATRE